MSDCCPLRCQDLNGISFYVRWFEGRYGQCITKDIKPFKGMAHRSAVTVNGKVMKQVDIVNMQTGKVFRNDLKKKFPDWLTDPTKRAIVAATGNMPLIYKNSRFEKEERGLIEKVDPVAQTA